MDAGTVGKPMPIDFNLTGLVTPHVLVYVTLKLPPV